MTNEQWLERLDRLVWDPARWADQFSALLDALEVELAIAELLAGDDVE